MPIGVLPVAGGGGFNGPGLPSIVVPNAYAVGSPVYFDGTNWVLADASASSSLGIAIVVSGSTIVFSGYVSGLPDPNLPIEQGGVLVPGTSLIAGQYYFVSAAVPGALTLTEPTTYSNPILFALSTTEAVVLPYRPSVTSTGGVTFSSGLDTARPAPSAGIVGSLYYATDAGVTYECVSATEWVVLGVGADKATFGPFSDSKYAANSKGPLGSNSFTWVLNYYCESVPPSELYLWACSAAGGGARGWGIGSAVGGTTCGLLLDLTGFVKTNLVGAVNTIGPHTLAVAYDNGTIRYAFDGVVQAPIVVPGVYVPAVLGDPHKIGGWIVASLPASWASISWLQAFSTVLSNVDLALISSSPSDYQPQAVGGTLVFDWQARRQVAGISAWTPTGSQSGQMAVTGPGDLIKTAR